MRTTLIANDPQWIGELPLIPLSEAETLESFAGITLKLSTDGYYAVHANGVLMAASPDKSAAVREFWRLCQFD